MNDGETVLVIDDPHLDRRSVSSGADEDHDGRVIGIVRLPMVLECVNHVRSGNIVPAGCRIDLHTDERSRYRGTSSTHVDDARGGNVRPQSSR